MSFSSRSYANRYIPSNRLPTGVKWLLISTTGISVLSIILQASKPDLALFRAFPLVPAAVVRGFAVWQLVTYLFLHGGLFHILWNMLALWMFGAELERTWGTARFVRFYFSCGILAGIAVIFAAYLFGGVNVPVVGSSGAVFGLLVAYGVLFPNQTMLFGFLIPLKTKYFVMIIGAVVLIESYLSVTARQGASEAVACVGGLIAGYLILRGRRLQGRVAAPVAAGYKDWKLRRARKKFEVYLRKKDSNRDRWVH
ncbi:MAG TPA: rhomboid family intramembrane serine protease [Bryobacteraceae bacterium]|jgi:membrane associated rhomboid family serine protease